MAAAAPPLRHRLRQQVGSSTWMLPTTSVAGGAGRISAEAVGTVGVTRCLCNGWLATVPPGCVGYAAYEHPADRLISHAVKDTGIRHPGA